MRLQPKQPTVNLTQEFIEIANDFSNPLDVIRESISNSYDAGATKIIISFVMETVHGDDELVLNIKDDGCGMDENSLGSFFDLGNSTKRNNTELIGEKGHGTKVFFNSSSLTVITSKDGFKYTAVMEAPLACLYDGYLPNIEIEREECDESEHGTEITIRGYNKNRCDKFKHELLKDYILWFTKHGSVENKIRSERIKSERQCRASDQHDLRCGDPVLILEVFGTHEEIPFGHVFPQDSNSINRLKQEHPGDAADYYVKSIYKEGGLSRHPNIRYNAVFCIEGNKAKWSYNDMIRRRGRTNSPDGAYTVQERYGIWICKDFIPIERKNEWIVSKGSEYCRFHAFFNCQNLRLTANRSSIENTPSDILDDIQNEIRRIYDEIQLTKDWMDLSDLEGASKALNTLEKETKMFKRRIGQIKSTKIADYEITEGKVIRLVEPTQENGVFAIFMQLQSAIPDLFPFVILDYNTHEGIDVLVKDVTNEESSIRGRNIYYVEFKNLLTSEYNHSFKNTHSIVCWDVEPSLLRGEENRVIDISNEERTLTRVSPNDTSGRTQYFLDAARSNKRIEVYCLKSYLEEVANIHFRNRNEQDVF